MFALLRRRVTSARFDARLMEWFCALGGVGVLLCGHLAVDRLGLEGLQALAGYAIVLILALLMAIMAVLGNIMAARAAPGDSK